MIRSIIIFALIFTFDVYSQPGIALPTKQLQHEVDISFALEPEIVVSVNYTYGISKSGSSPCFRVGGGIKLPTTLFSHSAWRVHLIGSANWQNDRNWGIIVNSLYYLVHNSNRAGAISGLGVELRANPGYYGENWIAALDLGWQCTVASHIKNSAETKSTFEDRYSEGVTGIGGPKDGWYGLTANRFRIGFMGSHPFSDKFALNIALGTLFAYQKQGLFASFDFAQLPVYFESTMSVGLDQ